MKILNPTLEFHKNIISLGNGIIAAEGWKPTSTYLLDDGSKSYRAHNPGNVFGSPFEYSHTSDGYSIFDDDWHGVFALCHQLERYCLGLTPGSSPEMTLSDMLKMYTGLADGQDFINYVDTVVAVSGLDRNVAIKELLS